MIFLAKLTSTFIALLGVQIFFIMKNIYFLFFFVTLMTSQANAQILSRSYQVNQTSDDAEESEDGTQTLFDSGDLELTFDDFSNQNNQTIGIRFTDIDIPSNAFIFNAYIQFHANDTSNGETNLTIKGESAASSNTFAELPENISSRITTQQTVNWSVPAWSEAHLGGTGERTPNLTILISEMITNNGWSIGNPLTFIITGTGDREAESFDGIEEEAPILVVDFVVPQGEFDLGISGLEGVTDVMLVRNNISLSAIIENPGLSAIESYDISYMVDGVAIGTESISINIPPGGSVVHNFMETFDLTTLGTHNIKAEISTDNDETIFNDIFEFEIEVIPDFSELYFEKSSFWKYLDDGSDLGADWINLDYDDNDWDVGSGEFGFGDGGENTLLDNGSVTYFFRKLVEVEDVNSISTVVAKMSADDALVIYVNGQEVTRTVNLPEGQITAATTPDRDVPHDFEDHEVLYNIPVSFFNTGINVIAVEVHNLSTADGDLSFSCEFNDDPIEYSVDGPYVFHRDGEMVIKNITEEGLLTEILPAGSNPTLTCDLPNGDSFSFNLMDSHEIPEAEYEMPDKFLVTGDIEGQFDAYIYLLQGGGVIDENYNWTYGDGHLFFIGDMFDRGEYVTQCLWLLYKLEQEAQLVGGQVHFIIGNHEVLNFEHDYRYVRDKYIENAHYMGEMLYDLYDQNTELGQWLRSKNILENAGNSALLIHAGLSPNVRNLNLTYQEINDFGRLGMDGNCPAGSAACEIVNGGSSEGVYWYRGIAREEVSQAQVDDIISYFNGETMIFGHTLFPQITPLYDQKVIAIDVDHGGNFEAGFMQALLFENGCYYRFIVGPNGNNQELVDPTCQLVNSTELTDSQLAFSVHPSLFEEALIVEYSAELSEGTIMVFNTLGVLLKTIPLAIHQENMTLNTANWTPGTYIISLESANKTTTRKVIKH